MTPRFDAQSCLWKGVLSSRHRVLRATALSMAFPSLDGMQQSGTNWIVWALRRITLFHRGPLCFLGHQVALDLTKRRFRE